MAKGGGGGVQIYALRDIEPGERISIAYIGVDYPVCARHVTLRGNYGFACTCDRCGSEAKADEADEADEANQANQAAADTEASFMEFQLQIITGLNAAQSGGDMLFAAFLEGNKAAWEGSRWKTVYVPCTHATHTLPQALPCRGCAPVYVPCAGAPRACGTGGRTVCAHAPSLSLSFSRLLACSRARCAIACAGAPLRACPCSHANPSVRVRVPRCVRATRPVPARAVRACGWVGGWVSWHADMCWTRCASSTPSILTTSRKPHHPRAKGPATV